MVPPSPAVSALSAAPVMLAWVVCLIVTKIVILADVPVVAVTACHVPVIVVAPAFRLPLHLSVVGIAALTVPALKTYLKRWPGPAPPPARYKGGIFYRLDTDCSAYL
jgi:hypothetical protein